MNRFILFSAPVVCFVCLVLTSPAANLVVSEQSQQPLFPPIPAATYDMTGNGYEGKFVIECVRVWPGYNWVMDVEGTLYGDKITGLYDRRDGKLRFLRGTKQFWTGDYDPKTTSLSGRFYVLAAEGGSPVTDGYSWRTTKLVSKKVVVPHVGEWSTGTAASELWKAGLRVKVNYGRRQGNDTSEGWVVGQSPRGGTQVDEGTLVTIQVNFGMPP